MPAPAAAASPRRSVLVTGATGKQGGAVARALLARGHEVHALTRDPGSAAARALAAQGATLHRGDYDEPGSVTGAARGLDAAYLVATPYEESPEAETRQGLQAVQALRDAGIRHLVYSSVASARDGTGIPHFESKLPIERAVEASGLAWTIVAPVYFMENLLQQPLVQGVARGVVRLPLPPDRGLQQVALADLGALVAEVLASPGAAEGQRIEAASDEVTGEGMASALAAALGREVRYEAVPLDPRRADTDLGRMFAWFDRRGYGVDIPALHAAHPGVGWHSFAAWALEQDWAQVLPEAPAAAR